MIDLHCHILPELDDGSQSLEESLAMARMAVNSGVRAMAATPHCMGMAFICAICAGLSKVACSSRTEGMPPGSQGRLSAKKSITNCKAASPMACTAICAPLATDHS